MGTVNLSDVTIGITSFLRPGFVHGVWDGIGYSFREAKSIIADDSDIPMHLAPWDIRLPFDSGLSAKRNAIVRATKTKYLLMGSDDFLYNQKAREGVELMREVLEQHPEVDVAAGRYNNNKYEGFIDYNVDHSYLKEIPLTSNANPYSRNPTTYKVDLTANYFLARTDKMPLWEESLKIGGEHILWFLILKQNKQTVLWVPGAEIDPQPRSQGKPDPRYRQYRKRAIDAHNWMKGYLGVTDYIDFNGGVS